MKCIVVIGMGRSGTSLLSQILQAKGVWFGNENNLIGKTPINVSGQMEHIPIQNIHNHLLKDAFAIDTWLFKGDLEQNWHKHEMIFPYKEALKFELRNLKNTCKSKFFGFKDARTTMLLPLWEDIFKETNIEPIYLLAYRQPEAIHKSLIRAGAVQNIPAPPQDIPVEAIQDIWHQYNNSAATVDYEMIQYDFWFKDPEFNDIILEDLGLPAKLGLELIHKEERHF